MADVVKEKLYDVEFVRDTRNREADEVIAKGSKMTLPESSAARWDRRGAIKILGEAKQAKANTQGDK